jgi:hypothetical protein
MDYIVELPLSNGFDDIYVCVDRFTDTRCPWSKRYWKWVQGAVGCLVGGFVPRAKVARSDVIIDKVSHMSSRARGIRDRHQFSVFEVTGGFSAGTDIACRHIFLDVGRHGGKPVIAGEEFESSCTAEVTSERIVVVHTEDFQSKRLRNVDAEFVEQKVISPFVGTGD